MLIEGDIVDLTFHDWLIERNLGRVRSFKMY